MADVHPNPESPMSIALALCALGPLLSTPAPPAESAPPDPTEAHFLIVPQLGVAALGSAAEAPRLATVKALCRVGLDEATTRLELVVENPHADPARARLWVPLPAEPSARSVTGPAAAAREAAVWGRAPALAFDAAVRSATPQPLEFAGHAALATDLFDLPPGASTFVVEYTHALPDVGADDARAARVFELPRSETGQAFEVPWIIDVRVTVVDGLADVFCPTHALKREWVAADELRLTSAAGRHPEPGPLVLFPIAADADLNGIVVGWPIDPEQPEFGGRFALAAAPSAAARDKARTRAREITFVLDKSGSMSGEKIEQAREAARQVLEGLRPDETFNVILYDTAVTPLFPEPVPANDEHLARAREFLAGAAAGGSTNIDGALKQALRGTPSEGRLPLVLFLTDGLPTAGVKGEREILANVDARNGAGRRIFAFGVGHDLNAPLLDGIATRTGATSRFVGPGEDIEAAVGAVLERLTGAVLARPVLRAVDAHGRTLADAVSMVLPEPLPDQFADDTLFALGAWSGAAPVELALEGEFLGEPRRFDFTFDPARAIGAAGFEPIQGRARRDSLLAFVPHLWSARRNALLIDAIRAGGAGGDNPADLKARAIELLRLGLRFGALTEYTAFLALDGPGNASPEEQLELLRQVLVDRALLARVGRAAITQSINANALRSQSVLNRLNRRVDDADREVLVGGVVPLGAGAFWLRGGETWVDSRLLEPGARRTVDEELAFGSEAHRLLVERLAERGRVAPLALPGNVALTVDGQNLLVRRP